MRGYPLEGLASAHVDLVLPRDVVIDVLARSPARSLEEPTQLLGEF